MVWARAVAGWRKAHNWWLRRLNALRQSERLAAAWAGWVRPGWQAACKACAAAAEAAGPKAGALMAEAKVQLRRAFDRFVVEMTRLYVDAMRVFHEEMTSVRIGGNRRGGSGGGGGGGESSGQEGSSSGGGGGGGGKRPKSRNKGKKS